MGRPVGPAVARAGRRPLPPAVKAYVVATAAAAALLLAGWWRAAPPPATTWPLLAAFAVAVAVATLFPLRLAQGRQATVAAAPEFAALLLLGPAAAMLAVGAGNLTAAAAQRRRGRGNRWEALFNAGQKLLSVGLPAGVLFGVPPSSPPFPVRFDRPGALAVLAAAAGVAYLVNTGAVALVIALQRRRSPWRVWLAGRRWDALPEATLYLLGALAAAAAGPSAWSLAVLALPLLAMHQALRQAAAAAEREGDRLKGELLGVVSHELRTPLGVIKGNVSSLQHYGDRLDLAARAEALQAIDAAADRLTALVDDLLDLQRLEAGRFALAHDLVDLRAVAAAVLADLLPRAEGYAFDLTVAGALPAVRGDAPRLRQVVQNLVDNAVKYSPEGGRVAVRLAARGDTVELRVEDQGIGLPPDQLERVFARFYRVDSSHTRGIGGTGLGLAIVQELVAAHGGQVRAESAGPGRGSAFVVTLPAAPDQPVADA